MSHRCYEEHSRLRLESHYGLDVITSEEGACLGLLCHYAPLGCRLAEACPMLGDHLPALAQCGFLGRWWTDNQPQFMCHAVDYTLMWCVDWFDWLDQFCDLLFF